MLPGTKLYNTTQDCFVLKDDRVCVQTASRTAPKETKHTKMNAKKEDAFDEHSRNAQHSHP
ncbi:hypothetical protein NIA69_02960 [Gemmiger formicilis]|nr:hypothetical protein [Gemmiger formicilis]